MYGVNKYFINYVLELKLLIKEPKKKQIKWTLLEIFKNNIIDPN